MLAAVTLQRGSNDTQRLLAERFAGAARNARHASATHDAAIAKLNRRARRPRSRVRAGQPTARLSRCGGGRRQLIFYLPDAGGLPRHTPRGLGFLARPRCTLEGYDAADGMNVDVSALGNLVLVQGGLHFRGDRSVLKGGLGALIGVFDRVPGTGCSIFGG